MRVKFKYYAISLDSSEETILNKLVDENHTVEMFTIDDWTVIDLLWRKHLVVYDKSRTKNPDIQPWCKSNVLRALSEDAYGD